MRYLFLTNLLTKDKWHFPIQSFYQFYSVVEGGGEGEDGEGLPGVRVSSPFIGHGNQGYCALIG